MTRTLLAAAALAAAFAIPAGARAAPAPEGTVTAEPGAWGDGAVEVTVQTASVDTRHERRDTHLRSAGFFDVGNHPTRTFRRRAATLEGIRLRLEGDLAIRGVTRPVVLEGGFLGGQGNRAGFSASTTVNRPDDGPEWHRIVDGSGMLGDDVEIPVVVALVRRTEG
ncbi:MAG TPA: YceI family protein [Gemmatimonadales bacterium]|nr:YceI family protein [Gemmatimonadales bacterium]